jgi:superfamily II DNA or RNA helicase
MEGKAGQGMIPWPHEIRAVDLTLAGIARGVRRQCVCIPTGGGKTWVMQQLALRWLAESLRTCLYSSRRALIEQTSRVFDAAGVFHGVRAAGYDDEAHYPLQITSFQTEQSRVMRRKTSKLFEAERVLVDEAHIQTGPKSAAILQEHVDMGGYCVGFTATPLGLEALYDELIVCGTTSELRACGALVPAVHYGPDEPDWRAFKVAIEKASITESDNVKLMQPARIFSRVFPEYLQLNPEMKPTILFGPDVEGSLWYAEQFTYPERRHESLRHLPAVPAAHLDGDDIWVDGEFHKASPELRKKVLDDSKSGRIRVLCNRFVLREGIDAPWLAHGIFATVFGSLQSYLQSGGRLLRAYPGMDSVIIQDHGGNWWRHGSLNEDRQWFLDQTAEIAAGLRADRIRAKKQPEPFRCPRCNRVWVGAKRCSVALGGCGYELENIKRSRPVIGTDGSLSEMTGPIFRPRRICARSDGAKIWERMYWRSRTEKGQRTFKAAAALFARENNWGWPNPAWPLMPIEPRDWYDLVEDVPFERLTSVPFVTSQPSE